MRRCASSCTAASSQISSVNSKRFVLGISDTHRNKGGAKAARHKIRRGRKAKVENEAVAGAKGEKRSSVPWANATLICFGVTSAHPLRLSQGNIMPVHAGTTRKVQRVCFPAFDFVVLCFLDKSDRRATNQAGTTASAKASSRSLAACCCLGLSASCLQNH